MRIWYEQSIRQIHRQVADKRQTKMSDTYRHTHEHIQREMLVCCMYVYITWCMFVCMCVFEKKEAIQRTVSELSSRMEALRVKFLKGFADDSRSKEPLGMSLLVFQSPIPLLTIYTFIGLFAFAPPHRVLQLQLTLQLAEKCSLSRKARSATKARWFAIHANICI